MNAKIVQLVVAHDGSFVEEGSGGFDSTLYALLDNGYILKHIPPGGTGKDFDSQGNLVDVGDRWRFIDPPTEDNIVVDPDQLKIWRQQRINPAKETFLDND